MTASWLSPALAALPTNPWRNRPINNRLLRPLYRPPGSTQFLPTDATKIWSTVTTRLASLRTSTWNIENHRAEGLSFFLSQDLTNEEAYTWAKLARILGGHLERQGEAMALAVARGFESTFGQPAAPNHWLELAHSKTILMLGDLDQPYPAKQIISKQARLFQSTPSPDRALGGTILPIAPQSEIALLGGLIRYILENRLYDSEYIQANTNALNRVVGNLTAKEITYAFQEDRLARAKVLEDEGTVFALLKSFYATYRPNIVSQLCGLPESIINNFYREVTVIQNRPLSIVYAQESAAPPLLCEQKIRAAAIISLLLGQVGQPGGGIVTLAPGWNPQGTADVGALGDSLPGYSGPLPQSDEDFILWTQRHSLSKARRTIAFLRSWYDLQDDDFGFSFLPKGKPNRTPEILFCVGAVPKIPLERLRTLVVLTTDNQMPKVSTKTEVFVLPLAHPSERGGTITDTGRRIVLLGADRRPSGQSQTGLALAAGLWSQVSVRLAKSSEERDRGIAAVRWPKVLSVEAVMTEMGGENLREPGQIARSEQAERCGVPVYAGLSYNQLRLRAFSEVDDSRIGLYPSYGVCWPGDIHIIGNRASADSQGKGKGFMGWDGKRWNGPDAPDVVDPLKSPEDGVDPFRGTPEGVARLIAVEYAGGLNLDTGIALERGIVPQLGFLPARRELSSQYTDFCSTRSQNSRSKACPRRTNFFHLPHHWFF
jgi:formate dehydrogenase major subunit